ncbi:MAG TPA: sugar phosphate isomerase/epimerase family protein [Candidatus Acidoferrales bacterium]|nr:sugar phosphate isomerase/epimerase family protein [Candidatus Acidoferrales bacterium]
MQRIFSTNMYRGQALTPLLLSEISHAGIDAVEIFCDSYHFAYGSAPAVRELASALNENGLVLHSLHAPTERDKASVRGSGVAISIADPERIRRQDAVDEMKRALEVAETLPFRFFVQDLATGHQAADPRKLDAAFNSLEILAIFAKHRGVTIALQNTPNEIGSPASLVQFVKDTHLHNLRFCFDIGHAHIEGGAVTGYHAMRDLVVAAHVHDNHGEKDEHLLPWKGTIDWDAALAELSAAPEPLPLVLELKEIAAGAPSLDQIREVFDKIEKQLEEKGSRSAHSA